VSRQPPTGPGGLIVVDKPAGMTSHDVVARVRRIVGTRRVGHAGTLDPMATGVLIVGVQRATRLLAHLVLTDKAYTATVRLGAASTTDDADGELLQRADAAGLADGAIDAALGALRGPLQQRPSAVSAVRVDGRRAYDRVRAGEAVQLATRPVLVSRFERLATPRRHEGWCDLEVVVECSSGTYVRALARDLGELLGVGGHLTALRRTRVGPFEVGGAIGLAELAALPEPVTLPLPTAIAAAMPVRRLSAADARELGFGRAIAAVGIEGTYGGLAEDGSAVALLTESDGRARPVLGFQPAG
jgi:tRNA pseudouridine55 synthase